MKRQAFLVKNILLAGILAAGMNLTSSCDSCSRPDGNSEGTEDANQTNADTRGSESATENEGSGSASGTSGQSDGGAASSGSGSGRSGASSTSSGSSSSASGSSSSGSSTSIADEQAATDRIENSSSTPRKANGQPVNSGGTSGTGMGTGTGSTGNNSRVTKPEDQQN